MDDLPALPILEVSSLVHSLSLTDDLPAQVSRLLGLPEELIVNTLSRINSNSRLLALPEELTVNILSRLNSDDLARCRAVSKAFPDICTKVRSVNLLCSLDRYTNSGQPITPFKEIVTRDVDLILRTSDVDSISIGVEERANHQPLDIELDDLHLTEVSFVDPLLKKVSEGLASLSISDYRMHSYRQCSGVLFLISMFCNNLRKLVLKNAWLTTYRLDPMPKLNSLTLAFVRLDDQDLSTVNRCCPSLRILELIMVEGLEKPQINLLHLRSCRYVGFSSATMPLIHAPNLTGIEIGFGPQIDKIISRKIDLRPEVLSYPESVPFTFARNYWSRYGV
ncbi:hypothetical protein RHSIM_Rhsim05G0031700 [Rhododendron simsii]|uniref:F-box domain-containing protein n=1 Tax=Rhododendron simsii TaxID=118357 RepID=A0A834LLX1_RHOSS|nr:hypothetical protein RHSIM_Rhsim05G0031700 [Rhododendron simsii]